MKLGHCLESVGVNLISRLFPQFFDSADPMARYLCFHDNSPQLRTMKGPFKPEVQLNDSSVPKILV